MEYKTELDTIRTKIHQDTMEFQELCIKFVYANIAFLVGMSPVKRLRYVANNLSRIPPYVYEDGMGVLGMVCSTSEVIYLLKTYPFMLSRTQDRLV